METLVKFAGDYSIAVLSVLSLVFVVKMFVGIIKNHINHNTSATKDLTVAIRELVVYLKLTTEDLKRKVLEDK